MTTPPLPPKRQKPASGHRTGSRSHHRAAAAATTTTTPALPQKKYYRQRAHANPFSDHKLSYPPSPSEMDWSTHYPSLPPGARIEVADIGCGFGGLLVGLSNRLPQAAMLGMEIRVQVAEYVHRRISALRAGSGVAVAGDGDGDGAGVVEDGMGPYENISVVRANAMKFLPNFFEKGQLRKIFLCFPDPHFKARKHKARIVSGTLAAEYAYVLAPCGVVYTVTDVQDLHLWIARHFDGHELFERVREEELKGEDGGACLEVMRGGTEEGKKVERNGGEMWVACWRRRVDPEWV